MLVAAAAALRKIPPVCKSGLAVSAHSFHCIVVNTHGRKITNQISFIKAPPNPDLAPIICSKTSLHLKTALVFNNSEPQRRKNKGVVLTVL